MSKIIVITSGKGGVGKTTTAINLGAAINHFGKDTLVIDCNLSTPNVDGGHNGLQYGSDNKMRSITSSLNNIDSS